MLLISTSHVNKIKKKISLVEGALEKEILSMKAILYMNRVPAALSLQILFLFKI